MLARGLEQVLEVRAAPRCAAAGRWAGARPAARACMPSRYRPSSPRTRPPHSTHSATRRCAVDRGRRARAAISLSERSSPAAKASAIANSLSATLRSSRAPPAMRSAYVRRHLRCLAEDHRHRLALPALRRPEHSREHDPRSGAGRLARYTCATSTSGQPLTMGCSGPKPIIGSGGIAEARTMGARCCRSGSSRRSGRRRG